MHIQNPTCEDQKIVLEVFFEAVAAVLDAILHRPEELPYATAVEIFHGEISAVPQLVKFDQDQKEQYDEFAEYLLKRWNSFEITR